MATNAGIMGASRLAYSMGQHRQLPAFLFKLHRKYNTPYVAIMTFCGVAVFLLLLGIVWRDIFVKLATIYAFASVLNFSFAHLSIIVLRFREPGHERPFKIPMNLKIMGGEIPIPSAIGLIGNTLVWVILAAGEAWARVTGIIWMAVGFAGYIIFRKIQKIPVMEAVTIERIVEAAYQPLDFYDIIVPTVGDLDASMIQTACKIALRDKSRILAVYVIEVPMTLPLDAKMTAEREKGEKALDQAEIIGKEYGVAVDTKLVQARSAGKAIVEEAIKRKSDLIMLGQPDKHEVNEIIGGKTINYVAQNAPCKVLINIAEKS
jgi:basic amino acid/polyamine antiporter, APA family